MPCAQEVAEDAEALILKHFTDWDSDGSGTIDKFELATIMYKISSSMSEREIDKLLGVIDTNGDGLIDFKEFVGWLTDREADRTVGNDGWIEKFDIHTLLRPMFNVFDRNKDGLIRRSELQECSQILGNSLSIHPASTNDCLVLDWKELPAKEEVSFQDFVDWQVKHLQKSGIPNNQLPTLLEELCESMQIIFDIDQLNQKGVENSKVHEALNDSVMKVADATRRIYTKKLASLDNMGSEAAAVQEPIWVNPPKANDMHLLARVCAMRCGIRLLNFQEEGSIEPAVDRNSKQRTTSSSHRPGKGARRPSHPSLGAGRRLSVRSELRLAIGQISLCIPDLSSSMTAKNRPWLAKVTRQRADPDKKGMIEDILIYSLDRETSKWYEYEDKARFEKMRRSLPGALQLFALLEAQALFGELSWSAAKGAMEAAEREGLLSEEAAEKYIEHMEAKAEDHIRDIRTDAEISQLDSIEEAAQEYLEEHVKVSPLEILAVLCDLRVVKVPDDVWKQILDADQV